MPGDDILLGDPGDAILQGNPGDAILLGNPGDAILLGNTIASDSIRRPKQTPRNFERVPDPMAGVHRRKEEDWTR